MVQHAIDWDAVPERDVADIDNLPPIVVPRPRRRLTRQVGVVKLYVPAKTYGLVAGETGDAIFSIDDVAACDRGRLDNGQAVTFEVVEGPDGQTARHIRIDRTTLPPRPDAGLVSKGWR
jgi:cold shock CspA family protein